MWLARGNRAHHECHESSGLDGLGSQQNGADQKFSDGLFLIPPLSTISELTAECTN